MSRMETNMVQMIKLPPSVTHHCTTPTNHLHDIAKQVKQKKKKAKANLAKKLKKKKSWLHFPNFENQRRLPRSICKVLRSSLQLAWSSTNDVQILPFPYSPHPPRAPPPPCSPNKWFHVGFCMYLLCWSTKWCWNRRLPAIFSSLDIKNIQQIEHKSAFLWEPSTATSPAMSGVWKVAIAFTLSSVSGILWCFFFIFSCFAVSRPNCNSF